MSIEARKIRLIMQLRREGITDTEVLSALERVPREAFIDKSFMDKAYENTALPIGKGQTISQPYVVAYMTHELQVDKTHRVLEIGTGSGYQASILCHLARRVYTIERHAELQEEATQKFEQLKIRNITYKTGDGFKGWKEAAPFDRIIVTASAQGGIPQDLLDQLSPEGGIMIVPVRLNPTTERLIKVTNNHGDYTTQEMIDVRFVPLVSEETDLVNPAEAAHA